MQPTYPDELILSEFGKTRDELIKLVSRHTMTVQGWLSSRSPQARKFEGKGVKASSTGFDLPLLNLALGCDFPTNATKKEIDDEVEAVKHFFANRNVSWYWWMNANPSPNNICSILENHGMEYDDPPLPAMVASLKLDFSTFPTYPEKICVWQAKSIEDLKAASRIRRLAFEFPDEQAISYFEDMASDWLENKGVKLFLSGENKAAPVSIGAVIDGDGIPGVYVMATLPDQHRKGYGKAILSRLMREAASQGHEVIALTASEAGFGLYAQFGFRHLFGFDFYIPPS
ncbi:MAG: GNAT family N-acetyltransferase [Anaerolineales bacterium]